MIEIIKSSDKRRLAERLERIRGRNVALDFELMSQVAAIIHDVRCRGDAALVDYTDRFDGCSIQPSDLRVDEQALKTAASKADPVFLDALREAIQRVRRFHEFERQDSWESRETSGVHFGQRIAPVASAGLYVPGGTASYPSSVVMNVIPAQIAGVGRIVVATPPRTLQENPAVAAALVDLGVTEVYAVGGAQAIAALAFGTETVPRVDKITGPGNKYVAAAKKLVFGSAGIDSIAGPSEVVILAEAPANPSYIAADLLAQSEHSPDASAMLITDSDELAVQVASQLKSQASTLPRREVIEKSLSDYGAIIVVAGIEEGCNLVNELAPEHLEILCRDEGIVAGNIRNAGAIFFGEHTPEATGDYLAGPNHVLPTSGAARFSSALGVYDFLKRTTILRFSSDELKKTAALIAALARAEGLEAHARSALIRTEAE